MPPILALCLAITVHDGDSLRCDGEKVRLANIDAPELRDSPRCSPRQRAKLVASKNPPWCDADLAERSRDALATFVGSGEVAIERTGADRYGRTLARISVNGVDAGEYLVGQGLARPWQ